MSNEWRFLIVEDKPDIARQLVDAIPAFVEEPDTAIPEVRKDFGDALKLLKQQRFDVLILDLKDDQASGLDEEDVSAGLAIFEELKKTRFAPVIFYTAHPHKVRPLQTEFVKVVEKTEGIEKLTIAVRGVMATHLPKLSRVIEDLQRDYMWDFVSAHWKEFDKKHQRVDLAYLLAGRLASTLRMRAAEFVRSTNDADALPVGTNVHPMQMYIYPTASQIQGGDIVAEISEPSASKWVVLTPTCDFVQKKAEAVLLAKCIPLTETAEYKNWALDQAKTDDLHALVGDNRKTIRGGPKIQPERFKYLPGTFFMEDSVIDFQSLKTVPIAALEQFQRVATLDSPFAEAVLSRFTRYFARLGTPDVEKASVVARLTECLPAKSNIPNSASSAAGGLKIATTGPMGSEEPPVNGVYEQSMRTEAAIAAEPKPNQLPPTNEGKM